MSLNRYLWGFINMALHLLVYGDFTPNVDEGVHYDTLTYQKSKSAGKLLATINIDNYRINNNIARIDDNINNFKSISYIIEEDLETHFYKCYYVTRIEQQSGYLLLYLSVDLWASYIEYAKINYPTIKRTNIKLNDNGFYDSIEMCKGRLTFDELTGTYGRYYKNEDICIVMLIQYNISQAVFGDDKITKTDLYAVDLKKLRDMVTDSAYSDLNAVEIAVALIGGVYSVTADIGTNDAQIINAWLLPKTFLRLADYGITIKTKSVYTGSNEKSINVAKVLANNSITLVNKQAYDINKVYYAGCYNNGLKLLNMTKSNLEYYIQCITDADEIKLNIIQGERQQDITNAVQVYLSVNASMQTGIRRVAKALSLSIDTGTSMYKNIASAQYSEAGLKAVKTISNMVNDFSLNSARGNGDAYFNYYLHGDPEYVASPFGVTYFESCKNENIHAGIYGATFNYEDNDTNNVILTLFIYNLIYVASQAYTSVKLGTYAHYLYLSMDANITGVPTDAIDLIKTKFSKGIKIASQEWENAQ